MRSPDCLIAFCYALFSNLGWNGKLRAEPWGRQGSIHHSKREIHCFMTAFHKGNFHRAVAKMAWARSEAIVLEASELCHVRNTSLQYLVHPDVALWRPTLPVSYQIGPGSANNWRSAPLFSPRLYACPLRMFLLCVASVAGRQRKLSTLNCCGAKTCRRTFQCCSCCR